MYGQTTITYKGGSFFRVECSTIYQIRYIIHTFYGLACDKAVQIRG